MYKLMSRVHFYSLMLLLVNMLTTQWLENREVGVLTCDLVQFFNNLDKRLMIQSVYTCENVW